jgi:uncharacterized membrane protein
LTLLVYGRQDGLDYDTALFHQAVRGYAFEGVPRIPIRGAELIQLGDHFSPVLILLAPLYWIRDDAINLMFAQAVLLALSVPFIWRFTRRVLGTASAYAVALAYGISWPMQMVLVGGFHEVAFAIPLMAVMFERQRAGRTGQAVAAAIGLLMVKEDMGFVVAGFGLCLVAEGARRTGFRLAAGGLAAVALLNFVFIPAMGGPEGRNWTFGGLGPTPSAGLLQALQHPVQAVVLLFDPAEVKVRTVIWLLIPVLFLALGSRLVLLAVPLVAERFLSDLTHHWWLALHYNGYVVVILFCAAVDAAGRLRWFPGVGRVWAAAVLAVGLALTPFFPTGALPDRSDKTALSAYCHWIPVCISAAWEPFQYTQIRK